MSANAYGMPPLVSEGAFAAFQAGVEDQGAVRRYLLDYLQMWDDRYARLCAAISAGNLAAAMDAVFSVRTSASMIGASRLATLASHIQRHLSVGDTQHAMALLDELGVCGMLTMDEFRGRILPGFGPDSTHDRVRAHAGNGHVSRDWRGGADRVIAALTPLALCELGAT